MAEDRCFPLPDTVLAEDANRGDNYYKAQIARLSQKCWNHYEKNRSDPKSRRKSIVKETLYTGSLGPCCYMRWKMATSSLLSGDNDTKLRMLMDALSSANEVVENDSLIRGDNDTGQAQVTLLNGDLVGALTMKIVIGNTAMKMITKEGVDPGDVDPQSLVKGIQDSIDKILQFASKYILSEALPPSECGILSGRAGYLKAIKFIQSELGDSNFGRMAVRSVLKQILEEGEQVGGSDLLLWKCKQKMQLGALNGITGILHTLLDFVEDLDAVGEGSWDLIEATMVKMTDYCLKSGNLAPSLKGNLPTSPPKKYDKLVQFCSGSPGHALLLLQMYRKSQHRDLTQEVNVDPKNFLMHAQHVAKTVVLPRGLLKKGVGLCHGISGNGFIFLGIYHTLVMSEGEEAPEEWLQYAYTYANFALDHLEELENTPDRPYSLYEGLAGLVLLLLGLVDGKSGFPCFEFF